MNKNVSLGMLVLTACVCSVSALALPADSIIVRVPEPATLGLLATGLVATVISRLRKRK